MRRPRVSHRRAKVASRPPERKIENGRLLVSTPISSSLNTQSVLSLPTWCLEPMKYVNLQVQFPQIMA